MTAFQRAATVQAVCEECHEEFLARGAGAVVCTKDACIRSRKNRRQNAQRAARREAERRAKGENT